MRNRFSPASGLEDPLDVILADIAIRIQLSDTAHRRAVERYESIRNWVERDGSPMAGLVELFYPQGSMAIGAAIASRVTNDEYDLDIVVQIKVPPGWTPKIVLDALYAAIRGEPGSRYYDKVERRTRCVTVSYSDMHLDLTPMERRPYRPEREGYIFHHKEGSIEPMHRCVANPFGFAEWFKENTEDQIGFAESYAARAKAYELSLLREADADSVPDQEPVAMKSLAVIALQLTKRWRNVQYQHRNGRKPPSVIMSEFAGESAGSTKNLTDELIHQAVLMRDRLRNTLPSSRVHIVNPVCKEDVLTDRWPANENDQRVFLADLEAFVRALNWLKSGRDLEEMRKVFVKLFGEGPTHTVFEDFNQRTGDAIRKGRSKHSHQNGAMAVPGVIGGGVPGPRHRFYGGSRWWE